MIVCTYTCIYIYTCVYVHYVCVYALPSVLILEVSLYVYIHVYVYIQWLIHTMAKRIKAQIHMHAQIRMSEPIYVHVYCCAWLLSFLHIHFPWMSQFMCMYIDVYDWFLVCIYVSTWMISYMCVLILMRIIDLWPIKRIRININTHTYLSLMRIIDLRPIKVNKKYRYQHTNIYHW